MQVDEAEMDGHDNGMKLFELPVAHLPMDLSLSLLHDVHDRKDSLNRKSNMGLQGNREQAPRIVQVAPDSGMGKDAPKTTTATAVINRTII